jgi:hypothetical protein
MINPSDIIESNIPAHIVENYPRFVAFLTAYYEWLSAKGNPHGAIKDHMDYMNFEKSLDSYVDFMQKEYLDSIPQDILSSKEQMINWSRDFHLSRGSHQSYKFIFNILFGEDDTEIYLPKDNILKPSDGTWIADQYLMLVSNPGNPEDLEFKTILQRREIFSGIFEEASAIVESFRIVYTNNFNIVELVITDVRGEFKSGFPITWGSGDAEDQIWPQRTVTNFRIEDAGEKYFTDERINLKDLSATFVQPLTVREAGKIDTQVTTILSADDIEIEVDGVILSQGDYDYDGQFVFSNAIVLGVDVVFRIQNVYEGNLQISKVNELGGIVEFRVYDVPIGINVDEIELEYITGASSQTIGFGSGFTGFAITGLVRGVDGYQRDTKGHMSSNMYIQDSDFYQNYSYVIRTGQDINKYADLVKEILHPAGFKFFGNIRVLTLIEIIIGIDQDGSGHFRPSTAFFDFVKYSLGNNYRWYAKNDAFLSSRVYKGDEFDTDFIDGDVDYDLEDKSNERTFNDDGTTVVVSKKGWMTKQPLVDSDIRQPQDYAYGGDFDKLYFESSYLLTNDVDESAFINRYINTYMVFDYATEDYAD